MPVSAVLSARGLGKRYGRKWALNDCDLDVPAGHVVGLVGPNGAGKTTLLHLAVGLLAPSAGSIEVLGRPPSDDPAQLARVGFVAQDTPTYARLSVEDHLAPGRAHEPRLGRRPGPPAHRRPRPRPQAAGRHALGRPAGPAGADAGRGEASRVPPPRRAGGQPRSAGPPRVPAEPDGGGGRPRGQRRVVVTPGRRPRAGVRLPGRARVVAGAGGRRGRRAPGLPPPAHRPTP